MMTCLHPAHAHLPSTCQLLTEGGDERIALDPAGGVNKYGCRPRPDNGLAAFGSATASTISELGFAAAEEIRKRLLLALESEDPAGLYLTEICRLRSEFIDLCGLKQIPGLEVIVSPSGTDVHMLASRLVGRSGAGRTLAIMVQPTETGSGVADALAGQIYPRYLSPNRSQDAERRHPSVDIATITIRAGDCALRPIETIDNELETMVSTAAKQYDKILITLTDISKTGILAPGPRRVVDLKRRWPDTVEVLIDAAQFRLAPDSLRGYLALDCMVAVTGSKFVGGPTFSAMLLVPGAAACRLMQRPVDPALRVTSARAEWSQDWNGIQALPQVSNFGLLLRWEAALAEMRAFRAASEEDVGHVVRTFRNAIASRLGGDRCFEPLEQSALDRRPLEIGPSWDQIPTIFPFLLFRIGPRGKRMPVGAEETKQIYNQLRSPTKRAGSSEASEGVSSIRCELGQPVSCGEREGTPVAALRLCLSARLIVGAVNAGDRGVACLIERGLTAVDKAAFLVRNP